MKLRLNHWAGATAALWAAPVLLAQDSPTPAPPPPPLERNLEFITKSGPDETPPSGTQKGDARGKASPKLRGQEQGEEAQEPTERRSKDSHDQQMVDAIAKSCRVREERMQALHEAAGKLRSAGHTEDAERLTQRLHAMMETRDPREDDARVANKIELDALKQQVQALSSQIKDLKVALEQNSKIMDEVIRRAVPEPSPADGEQLRQEADLVTPNKGSGEVRKAK